MVPKESVIVAALQRGKKIKPSTSQTSQMKLHGGPLFFGARHLGKWSQSSRSLTFFIWGCFPWTFSTSGIWGLPET